MSNKTSLVLIQIAYLGRRSFVYVKFYASFFEQVYKGIIIIPAKADISLYPGVHQHLGTEYTRCMCCIDGAPLKADTMETGLYDYILLSMNAPTYFLSRPRWYMKLIPETTKLKAVFKASRGTIVTRSQYVFVSYCHCSYVVTATG